LLIFALRRFLSEPIFGCRDYLAKGGGKGQTNFSPRIGSKTGRPPFCRLFLPRTCSHFSDKFLWTKAFSKHKIESMKLAILQDCGSISA
jgi:hypothetical protein